MEASMTRNCLVQLIVVIILSIAATILIAASGMDLKVSSFFYVPGGGFIYGDRQPWHTLYHFGVWPAYIMVFTALLFLLISFFRKGVGSYRKKAVFLILFILLGPGLLVNVCFKDHWGRPRPRQIAEFGGTQTFHHPWQKDHLPQCKSFPCGHAAAAIYLIAPFFLLRRTSRYHALAWLTVGIGYWIIMGAARIVQGGHFVSDVLWRGAIVYLTGVLLADLMKLDSG